MGISFSFFGYYVSHISKKTSRMNKLKLRNCIISIKKQMEMA